MAPSALHRQQGRDTEVGIPMSKHSLRHGHVPPPSLRQAPAPIDFLAELEARHRHPAGLDLPAPGDPIATADEFHAEVDAQTGRVLPRTIPARGAITACAFGFDEEPASRSQIAAGIVLTILLGGVLGIAAWAWIAGAA